MPQLSRKIGPLPLWAWGGIIGGAGLGFILYQRRKAADAAAAGDQTTAYNAMTDYGQIDPNTGVPYALEGTGTGAFGPIDPDSGVPYAFEAGAGGAGGMSTADITGLLNAIGTLFGGGPTTGGKHHHRKDPCPPGYHLKKGKCVKDKGSGNGHHHHGDGGQVGPGGPGSEGQGHHHRHHHPHHHAGHYNHADHGGPRHRPPAPPHSRIQPLRANGVQTAMARKGPQPLGRPTVHIPPPQAKRGGGNAPGLRGRSGSPSRRAQRRAR